MRRESLDKSPNTEGKVVLTWTINDEGNVTKVVVNENSTTLKDADLHNCMTRKLKLWKFPPAPKGELVEVNYPFKFSPGESK